jgi:hypothetical protein
MEPYRRSLPFYPHPAQPTVEETLDELERVARFLRIDPLQMSAAYEALEKVRREHPIVPASMSEPTRVQIAIRELMQDDEADICPICGEAPHQCFGHSLISPTSAPHSGVCPDFLD